MKSNILFLFSAACCLLACDKVTEPYETKLSSGDCVEPVFTANTNTLRNILIEDFTGHTCGNCTDAALEIESLKAAYGGQIISVAIHTGSFATTQSGTGKYYTDFTTSHGDKIRGDFGVIDYPTGMISRSNGVGYVPQWDGMVQAIKDDIPVVNLQVQAHLNDTTGEICVSAESEVLQALSNNHYLVVVVTEDSIVDWQKDYSNVSNVDVPDYVHNHVLRDHVNGTYGQLVLTPSMSVGKKVISTYSYTANSAWDKAQMSFIAYLFDESSKEIMQVAKTHLQ